MNGTGGGWSASGRRCFGCGGRCSATPPRGAGRIGQPTMNAAADPKALRERLGLSRKGIEAAAKAHIEASGWMRDHLTKAIGLHVADEVWETIDRHLFADASGRRHGSPRIGSWWDFTRIPGPRPLAHQDHPTWETYRLVGTLDGHLAAYRHPQLPAAVTTGAAAAAQAGRHLDSGPARPAPAPARPARRGPITMARWRWCSLACPLGMWCCRCGCPKAQASGRTCAISWPTRRVAQDRPGAGARPQSTRWLALLRPSTRPSGRVSVRGHWVSSRPDPRRPTRRSGCQRVQPGSRIVPRWTARAAGPRPDRLHHLSSRRPRTGQPRKPGPGRRLWIAPGATPMLTSTAPRCASTNAPSTAPTKGWRPGRSPTRQGRGMPARTGCRCAPTATTSSRAAISAHAVITPPSPAAPVRPNRPAPDQVAARIVAAHGNTITVEDCRISTWARLWGKRIALFSPGMLVAALERECQATGGTLYRAGTRTTALSQHCLCGAVSPRPWRSESMTAPTAA